MYLAELFFICIGIGILSRKKLSFFWVGNGPVILENLKNWAARGQNSDFLQHPRQVPAQRASEVFLPECPNPYTNGRTFTKIHRANQGFKTGNACFSDSRSQVLNSQIPAPRSQVSDPRSQISDLRSQISDPRSQIPDLRSQVPTPRSQLPGPSSQIPGSWVGKARVPSK